ncbi:hypothetical protein DNTS_018292 [Danionella cerebrum]|uniref:Uncharacterized protein n=1 Tax=Danionella cerebrum TaxID=2873325 RepID=A0A553QEN2_9TELE|nr:hypothetical protein DNTS_018292 [Danionella translucida]
MRRMLKDNWDPVCPPGARVAVGARPTFSRSSLAMGVCYLLLLAPGSGADPARTDPNLEIYKRLFESKRKDHLNALKNLVDLNDVNQQHKIINIMLKGLFKV